MHLMGKVDKALKRCKHIRNGLPWLIVNDVAYCPKCGVRQEIDWTLTQPSSSRAALIGMGYWGQKLVKYIDKSFDLRYVCNSKTDLHYLLQDKTVTTVFVATPIETHYAIVLDCLLSDKDVFCEKPLTLDEKHTNELVKCSEMMRRSLGVDYVLSFGKTLDQLRLVLDNHKGDIEYAHFETKHLGRFLNYDVFWLLAPHYLSVLQKLFGLPSGWKGYLETQKWSCSGLASTGRVRFEGYDFPIDIDVSLDYPGKALGFEIYAKGMTIKCDLTTVGDTTARIVYYDNHKQLPIVPVRQIGMNIYGGGREEKKHGLRDYMQYVHNCLSYKDYPNHQYGDIEAFLRKAGAQTRVPEREYVKNSLSERERSALIRTHRKA